MYTFCLNCNFVNIMLFIVFYQLFLSLFIYNLYPTWRSNSWPKIQSSMLYWRSQPGAPIIFFLNKNDSLLFCILFSSYQPTYRHYIYLTSFQLWLLGYFWFLGFTNNVTIKLFCTWMTLSVEKFLEVELSQRACMLLILRKDFWTDF